VIIGTIDFLDKESNIKTIVRTNDFKEYILSPSQPKKIYESFGIKDGSKVKIQGKILENTLEWFSIRPLEN
jgi:hypothetical protein